MDRPQPESARIRHRQLATPLATTFAIGLTLVGLVLLVAASPAPSLAAGATAEILFEDFEGSDPLSDWTLAPSRPEVSATVALGQGYIGQGAYIDFAVDQSYHWIDFTKSITPGIEVYAISFWVKSPPDAMISLLVDHQFGQEGQSVRLTRPFQAYHEDGWYRHLVRLDEPVTIYGLGVRVERGRGHWTVAGEIAVDNFVVHTEPILYDVDPASIPMAPAIYSAPSFASIMGADEVQFEGPDTQALDLAAAMGARYLRAGTVTWHWVEDKDGIRHFEDADAVVTAHQAHGLQTIFGIDGGSYVDTGDWNIPPRSEEELAAFGDYAADVAQRYRSRAMVYDIYGEPRNWQARVPPLTAEEFAAILNTASQRIRQEDPEATIISGGLLGYDREYLSGILGAGGLDGIDGFGIHSYNIGDPESLSESLLMVRSVMSEYLGQPLPVWDTEWGFSSVAYGSVTMAEARLRQARLVAREYLSGWANGLQSVIYWSFRDRGEDPEEVYDHFGLIDWNYQPKPSYQASKTVYNMAQGRTLVGIIDGLPSDCYGLKLDTRHDALLVLWTTAGVPLTVTVPADTTAVDFLGEDLPLTLSGGKRIVELTKAMGPVYLTCPSCASSLHAVYVPVAVRGQ